MTKKNERRDLANDIMSVVRGGTKSGPKPRRQKSEPRFALVSHVSPHARARSVIQRSGAR